MFVSQLPGEFRSIPLPPFLCCWSGMTATGKELTEGRKGGGPGRSQGGKAETTRDDGRVADAEESRWKIETNNGKRR